MAPAPPDADRYRIIWNGQLTEPIWFMACAKPSRHGSLLVETFEPEHLERVISEAEIFGPATPLQAAVLQQLADAIGIPYDGYNCLEIKEWDGIRFLRNFVVSCYEDYIRAIRSLDYIVSFADPDYVQAFLARLQLLKVEEEQWYAAG